MAAWISKEEMMNEEDLGSKKGINDCCKVGEVTYYDIRTTEELEQEKKKKKVSGNHRIMKY